MLLKNKNAIVYGGGGSIGGAVARAFAREGAKVFVTGPTLKSVQATVDAIIAFGGQTEGAVVNALDKDAVDNYLASILHKTDSIDISFNAIDVMAVQNISLTDMEAEDFYRPIERTMKSHFITMTAAARQMVKQGNGTILAITATPGGVAYPEVGGFGPSCSLLEGLVRNLAAEVGPHGVRVACIRSAGSPDSRGFVEAATANPAMYNQALGRLVEDTMLKKLPLTADIGNLAVFLASNLSAALTGTTINATCGTTRD